VETATDYSIGFMRFEWRNGHDNLQSSTNGDVPGFTLPLTAIVPTQSSKDQMIWEHRWDLSSAEVFRNRHTVSIQGCRRAATRNDGIKTVGEQQQPQTILYFTGGGNGHQGLVMA
jgi:hypothetical protein